MAIVLGFDIGTTSTIGILIDSEGKVLALRERPVTLSSPHPGWAEEDPEAWWSNVCNLVPELLADGGVKSTDVSAVGVSGMVPALVMLDEDDRPVRPSIQQSDGRTGVEVDAMRREIDEAGFLARTGNGINQQLIAPKLRWLHSHEPHALARTRTILGSYDFIARRLTGSASLETNWALEAGFYDLDSRTIADDLVALGGIDGSLMPPCRVAHEIIGTVTGAAAQTTGLAAGTPVVAGAADHVASAYVAGVTAPGDVLIKFGGAGDILIATSEPRPDVRLFLDAHLVPGQWLPNGCMVASGSILNWFVRTIGAGEAAKAEADGTRPHAALDRLAAGIAAGSQGLVLLPYFLGEKTPIHDPSARGTLIGLGLHHDVGAMWRATLEAVCYGFRHHVAVAEDIGYPIARVIASDGGTRSALWMQIAADVLGREVALLDGHPGSCLGAAFVAGIGIGAFDEWTQISRFVKPARVVEPDPAAVAVYDDGFAAYRATYEALKPVYPMLARIGG